MATLSQLENEIKKIKDRNKQVEGDKAWELSFARRSLLTIFTYLAVGVYLYVIRIPDPWLNAIVPAVAFMLSTLTIPFFRRMWLKKYNR